MEDTVTIPRKEYEKLIADQKLLEALRDAGVDNWKWYGEAINALNSDNS